MRFNIVMLFCLLLVAGCHNARPAPVPGGDKPCPVTVVWGKAPVYPALRAYANAQGLAAKGDCWQGFDGRIKELNWGAEHV
jgi:hypothetical protein